MTPDGSGPVQVILRDPALPWREEDLSGLDAAACEARLEALAQAERAVRFDPSSAPLLRFVLVRLDVQRHRLLTTNHHLLLDGWSMPLLLAELLTLYRLGDGGASLGRPAAFASHLRWLAGRDQEAARAAWGAHLAGLSGATLLAPSHSVARRTLVGQRVVRKLDATLSAALGEMARGAGLTLATLLQGAWAILLGRLTGRDDVVFGVTVSGRTGEVADDDRIIGLLINTVPVRVRLAAAQPVRALLSGLQAEQAGLLAHQHAGLAELQRMAGVGVLFDTAMVVENYPLDAASLADAAGEVRLSGASVHDASHYPLSLVAVPGERLELILRHHPDLIGDAEAAAIADRLVRVLAAMVATPELPVSRLDVLPALEREAVLVGFNTATAAPPGLTDASLVSLFAAQVARAPDAVALIHGEAELSYAALEVGANRLAHHLRGLGVGPERVVGICLDRSFGLVEAMLAVLKAGGAYLPLDPAYPPERLAMMLADAAPVAVLTTSALAGSLPADAPCVALDQLDLGGLPTTPPAMVVHPHSPAYVIYTSGCTGRPKGVVVSNRNVTQLLAATPWPSVPTTSGPCSTPTRSTSPSGRSGGALTAAGWSSSTTHRRASPNEFRELLVTARHGSESDAVRVLPIDAADRDTDDSTGLVVALCDLRRRGPGPARARRMDCATRRQEAAPGQHVRHHRDHGYT